MLFPLFQIRLSRVRAGAHRARQFYGKQWFDRMSRDHLTFSDGETPAAQLYGRAGYHEAGCARLGIPRESRWHRINLGLEPERWDDPGEINDLVRAWDLVITEALSERLRRHT